MAEPLVVSGLLDKYSRILGRLKRVEAEAETLRADLAHIEAAVRLFKADYDFRAVLPRRTNNRHDEGKPLIRTVMDVLRESTEPLSSRQIAYRVYKIRGVERPEEILLRRMGNAINASLRRQQTREMVACHEKESPVVWELV